MVMIVGAVAGAAACGAPGAMMMAPALVEIKPMRAGARPPLPGKVTAAPRDRPKRKRRTAP